MIPEISVILPTFNEKENILSLISAIEKALEDRPYEILVVDDQSPDGTANIVQEAALTFVRVIMRTQEPGYAKSIDCGIENAKGKILVLMDSDFNHNPKDLPSMLKLIAENDVVSASRFIRGGGMTPLWRSLCSHGFNKFICRLTASKLTDHLFGFLVIRSSCFLQCQREKIFYGFGDYTIRLLYYLQKKSYKIVEVPSVYGQRLSGHGNQDFIKNLYSYTKETLALARQGKIE